MHFIVTTRSVYDPPRTAEGTRVLVSRYWPRGIKKDRQDLWLRELGPSRELIRDLKSGIIGWDEFRSRYLEEFDREAKGRWLTEIVRATEDAAAAGQEGATGQEGEAGPGLAGDAGEAGPVGSERATVEARVVLMCACRDRAHCHSNILREMLEGGTGR